MADTTLHGMALGSEMSGGVENVYVQNFNISMVEEYGLQFKANKDRGGYIRDVYIENMNFDTVMTAILFTNDYHSYAGGDNPSEFYDITIKNIDCQYASGRGIVISGTKENPVRNIILKNVTIYDSEQESVSDFVEDLELDNVYINSKKVKKLNN
jgi:polygalacturonase